MREGKARSRDKTLPLVRGLSFPTYAMFRAALTPARVDLLKLIRRREPDSIYELARLAGRDVRSVRSDVRELASLGLVDVTKKRGKSRARNVPRVPYSKLEIEVEV
ncbi:MAG: HVO_A0114 family putative DNA-binding protein [Thermoplasmatota archaeon]